MSDWHLIIHWPSLYLLLLLNTKLNKHLILGERDLDEFNIDATTWLFGVDLFDTETCIFALNCVTD